MPLPQLEPQSRIGDQVFEAIHGAIMGGNYPAGHRLRIRDVAAELGTSVMPVREAIRRLEEVGLVETLPNRGARVKGFTPAELLHVYAVRRLLEIEASGLGAVQISDRDIARLHEAYAAMESHLQAGEVVPYLEADERFLDVIYQAAGNPILVETIHVLWQRCRSYKIVGASNELEHGNSDMLLTFQAQLLQAAIDRSSSTARELTAASLDAATDRIRQALPEN
ncbi:GntR family transcriptional regulator [Citricoccus nitrophenolicus]